MNNNLIYCQHCHSSRVISRGYEKTDSKIKRRYVCKDCKKGTYLTIHEQGDEEYDDVPVRPYVWDDKQASEMLSQYKGFVISCIQNDTTTNYRFVEALKAYCKYNGYRLILIPIRYQNPNCMERPTHPLFDRSLEQYFIENELHLNGNVKVVGNINIQATAVNPVSGLNYICQGKTTIIGHPQLQLTSLPVNSGESPILLSTTGTVSNENRFRTDEKNIPKAGYRPMFFRNHAATVIETEPDDSFHMRQLCADESGGFYDHMGYFSGDGDVIEGIGHGDVTAVITGDEHWFHMDTDVARATYGDSDDSVLGNFKPDYIIRHDVLDSHSVSHHHKNDVLKKYEKHHRNKDNLESELRITADSILKTTPEYSTNVIVPSNHNEHIERWLSECDPAKEPWNSKLFHELMYKCMDYIEKNPNSHPDPFELWFKSYYDDDNMKFLKRDESFVLHGIILNQHGDKGPNGAKATNTNLSRAGHKMVKGHSHTISIEKGVWSVGISARTDLEYTKGAMSSWTHTHCILYSNGQRQLINVIGDKWKP